MSFLQLAIFYIGILTSVIAVYGWVEMIAQDSWDTIAQTHYIKSEQELVQIMNKKISSGETKFTIPIDLSEMDQQEVLNAYKNTFKAEDVIDDNELTYVFSYNRKSKAKMKVCLTPYGKPEEKEKIDQFIRQWVQKNVTEDMTDEKKVREIHDFIVLNYKGYIGNKSNEDLQYSFDSPAGLIFGEGGKCLSYSRLFAKMAKASGLEVLYVLGEARSSDGWGGHAWNMVKVQNEWYFIDVTWDDPIGAPENEVSYMFYLKNTEHMKKTHRWDSYSYPDVALSYHDRF